MNDIELLELMKSIDPQSVRVPPGVRKIVEAAILLEREACAKTCEMAHKGGGEIHGTRIYFERCADAIRKRSNELLSGGADPATSART